MARGVKFDSICRTAQLRLPDRADQPSVGPHRDGTQNEIIRPCVLSYNSGKPGTTIRGRRQTYGLEQGGKMRVSVLFGPLIGVSLLAIAAELGIGIAAAEMRIAVAGPLSISQ